MVRFFAAYYPFRIWSKWSDFFTSRFLIKTDRKIPGPVRGQDVGRNPDVLFSRAVRYGTWGYVLYLRHEAIRPPFFYPRFAPLVRFFTRVDPFRIWPKWNEFFLPEVAILVSRRAGLAGIPF